jgi:DNA end-binding protein Ku
MAPKPFWKGYLKFSLVTCPVAMAPALTEGARIRFHVVNRRSGAPIESRYVDAETGAEVAPEDEVKGYPIAEDRHVILGDEELEGVALESTRTIDLETFAPRDSIGWIWLDRPHHLTPDGRVGEEAYAVIRDALAATGTVGIARLVLYRRERAVMLEPRGRGMMLWTLRYGDEVRAPEPELVARVEGERPDAKALKLIAALIEKRTVPWSEDFVRDPVQARLAEIIAAKRRKGRPARRPKAAPEPEPADNVVSITEALKRSLAAEKGGKRR